jgi:hypothetical protein
MSTANERASRVRGRLSERANGIRSGLAARRQSIAQGLIRDLSQIVEPERAQPVLRREQAKGAIPAARGVSQRNYQAGTDGGSGIASPLIEGGSASGTEPVLDRTYHAPREVVSSDGLFVWEVAAINTITLRDANNAEVEIKLAEPDNPEP